MLLLCFPLFLLRRLYLLTWHMGEWQAWMAQRSLAALAGRGLNESGSCQLLLSSYSQCSCILEVSTAYGRQPLQHNTQLSGSGCASEVWQLSVGTCD
jgi:hypothetical protein